MACPSARAQPSTAQHSPAQPRACVCREQYLDIDTAFLPVQYLLYLNACVDRWRDVCHYHRGRGESYPETSPWKRKETNHPYVTKSKHISCLPIYGCFLNSSQSNGKYNGVSSRQCVKLSKHQHHVCVA